MTKMNTPWGIAQTITRLADGIERVSTASHGGIHLSPERMAQMPEAYRSTPYSHGGWFEEDCDWALVAITFPDAFSAADVSAAKRTVDNFYSDLTGEKI